MMIQRIELAPSSDPWAVRSVDFGLQDRTLLVGRHSSDGRRRLASIDIQSSNWLTSYDWALEGAATRARYADTHRQIVYVDEGANARVIPADSRNEEPPRFLSNGVRHLTVARKAPIVALSGVRCEVRDLGGDVVWAAGEPAIAAIDDAGGVCAFMGTNTAELQWLDVASGRQIRSVLTPLAGAEAVTLDGRTRWVSVIGAGMQGCGVWSSATGAAAGEIFCNADQNNNTCQALHPLRDLVAYGTIAGYVVIVDLQSNDIVYMEGLHESRVWDLAFSSNGRHLATAGDDGSIRVLQLDEVEGLGTSPVRV